MNKFKLSAVAIIASLVLTACGGGGGNNSNNQPKESTINQTGPTQSTPQIDFPVMTARLVGEVDKNDYELGSVEKTWKSGASEKAKMLAENRQYTWNGIIVRSETPSAGQQLINLNPNIQLDIETNRANLSTLGTNSNLNHAFKGSITSYDSETFFQAVSPPDSVIPTSGKATYKGNAIRYDIVSLRPRGVGETVINVDFTNKKIDGRITTEGHRRNIILLPTSLGTRHDSTKMINSSGEEVEEKTPLAFFNGKAIAEANLIYPKDVEGTYNGALAGPNVEEVAGSVDFGNTTEQVSGETPISFSAVKQ